LSSLAVVVAAAFAAAAVAVVATDHHSVASQVVEVQLQRLGYRS
jgi:hypothetical protein